MSNAPRDRWPVHVTPEDRDGTRQGRRSVYLAAGVVGGVLIACGPLIAELSWAGYALALSPIAGLIVGAVLGHRLVPVYRSGLCAKCGYDLCKSPVRCPECGTVR